MISTARRLAATSRVVVAVTLVALGSSSVQAADKVRMMLDWAFQAQSAPFVTAVEKGYFAAENLEVSIDRGYGSSDAVTKLATGAYDIAFGDVNSMMEFNAKNPAKGQMTPVMMIFDRPALALFTFDAAIKTPKDLEGKRVLTSPGKPISAYSACCRLGGHRSQQGRLRQRAAATSRDAACENQETRRRATIRKLHGSRRSEPICRR